MLHRLVALLIALVATFLTAPLQSEAAAPAILAATYSYDGHRTSVAWTYTAAERGPPVSYNDTTTIYDAAGRRARGTSTPLNVPSTHATYDYDDLARFVPIAARSRDAEGQAASAEANAAVVTGSQVAAETESGAASAINGVRLRAQLTGEQIAGGHAFDAHVLEAGEFPGITTRQQFATRIEEVVTNGESRELLRGRTAYWEGNTVVILDTPSLDGGTAFVPTGGYNYFLGLK